MAECDDALYAHLAALDFFPPEGKVEDANAEEVGLDSDFSQEKKKKKKQQPKSKPKQKKETDGYESDCEELKPAVKRKRTSLKLKMPLPPSPLKTEPPSSPYHPHPKCKKSMTKMLEAMTVEVLSSGTVSSAKTSKKKKKQSPDLWKVKRDRIMKIRKSQEVAREMSVLTETVAEVRLNEKTADNYFYMQLLSGKLEVIRHSLLVEELVNAAKAVCVKRCHGCRDDTVSNHISTCVENTAVLLQVEVEEFVSTLFGKSKDGDYYIDERFAMLIDKLVPSGLDIREEFSFPTYVLHQYLLRLNNPKAEAALKKVGLDLPLQADVSHGLDRVGVMPTMLSVLCAKRCLTPTGHLMGID